MVKTHIYVFGSGDCGQLALGEDVEQSLVPKLHPFFEKIPIVSVVAGGLHSLALSADGRVFSWGCNDEKALGHAFPEFVVGQVEGLEGKRIVQVAAGDSISAALTDEGKVFSWGTFRVLLAQPTNPLINMRRIPRGSLDIRSIRRYKRGRC